MEKVRSRLRAEWPGSFQRERQFRARFRFKYERAAQHVTVSGDVLGDRVHGDIGAKLQGRWFMDVATVLSQATRILLLFRHGNDRRDIRDAEQRVGRRFHPDEPGLGSDGLFNRAQVLHVDLRVSKSPVAHQAFQQDERAVKDVRSGEDVVARGQRLKHRERGCAAGGESQRRGAIFNRGQSTLQSLPIRVTGPRIQMTARQTAISSLSNVVERWMAGVTSRVDSLQMAGVNSFGLNLHDETE